MTDKDLSYYQKPEIEEKELKLNNNPPHISIKTNEVEIIFSQSMDQNKYLVGYIIGENSAYMMLPQTVDKISIMEMIRIINDIIPHTTFKRLVDKRV